MPYEVPEEDDRGPIRRITEGVTATHQTRSPAIRSPHGAGLVQENRHGAETYQHSLLIPRMCATTTRRPWRHAAQQIRNRDALIWFNRAANQRKRTKR
jgi:hypothetical protein